MIESTGYEHEQAPGQLDRTITVTLASGRPWDMPVHVAKTILEGIARQHPRLFGDHLQGALMGEMPAGRRSSSRGT